MDAKAKGRNQGLSPFIHHLIDKQARTYRCQAAPGRVAITADAWTADMTKDSFLGLTGHWIDVKKDGKNKKWTLRSEVLGYQGISSAHSRLNLGCYLVGLCKRVGIISKNNSKVCCIPD